MNNHAAIAASIAAADPPMISIDDIESEDTAYIEMSLVINESAVKLFPLPSSFVFHLSLSEGKEGILSPNEVL